jgi:DNA polymerase
VTDLRRHLADHLRLLQELGIDGASRDPAWASRPDERRAAGTGDVPGAGPAADRTSPSQPFTSGAGRAPATAPVERLPGPAASGPAPASLFDEPGPSPPVREPGAALAEIRADLGECTRCKLHALGRTQVVYGVGSPKARLMFIGEAPGGDEDVQGIPFVGRAGQLLTRIIEAMGMSRDEVYIANVIKCRPPGNRNPEPDEVATCEPFLFRQVDAIRPEVIVALGTFAAQALLRTKDPISRLRGQVFKYRGAKLVPTFHPAFLLRSPEKKRETWDDMKKVMALLKGAETGAAGPKVEG